MSFAKELAITAVLASILLPLGLLKSPEIADVLDPLPVAIAGDFPSIIYVPVPELRP